MLQVADRLSKATRSRLMSRIRCRDTKPEIIVRKALHCMGFRFRLHDKGLPGKPDIVLPKWKTVIFVHGCFWHQHQSAGCPYVNQPKSNIHYWTPKLKRAVERDKSHMEKLIGNGWKVLVLWECELTEERMYLLKSDIRRC